MLAWSYTTERTVAGASAYEPHSYAYVEGAMLLDYSAADGKYKLWNVPTLRALVAQAFSGRQPQAAHWRSRATRSRRFPLARSAPSAWSITEPEIGDFRLGSCNRSATVSAGHLDCRTSTNGTWHTGGFQLAVGRW